MWGDLRARQSSRGVCRLGNGVWEGGKQAGLACAADTWASAERGGLRNRSSGQRHCWVSLSKAEGLELSSGKF